MFPRLRRLLITPLIFCICFCTSRPAQANIGYASDGKAIGVIIAVVAVATVAGFGVYYFVHHGHNLTGCAAGSGSSLTLTRDSSQDTYILTGQIQGIRSGDRVRVSGDKVQDRSTGKSFIVSKLSKDYGACKAT